MRPSRELASLLAAVGMCGACSDPDACTAEARLAIEVEPHDAISDEFIAVAARGLVREGTYEDSLRVVRSFVGSDPALPVPLGAAEDTGEGRSFRRPKARRAAGIAVQTGAREAKRAPA